MAHPSSRSGRTEVALAAGAAAALAVVLTWPIALHPTARLAGHPGNDSWNHAWGYWWVGRELAAGRWPSHTDLLHFPSGGSLFFIDAVQAVATTPLQVLGGPALAFNATIVGGLALAGLAAWLLARRVSGDAVTSGLALVLFESSPHLLGQAADGISETVAAGWLPLALWCLVRLVDRPTAGRAAALGLAGAGSVWAGFYLGVMSAVGVAVVVTWTAVRQPWALSRQLAWRLAQALAVAGALALPVLSAFRASVVAADGLVTRDPDFVAGSLLHHNMTDVLAMVRPGRVASPDLLALYDEHLLIVVYLGWLGLALAGVAIVATRRRRELGPWLWLGVVFLLLSLGPYLYVGGGYPEVAGHRVPAPFVLLYRALPAFDRISHPFRFVTGIGLAIAVAATVGLRHLLRGRSPAVRAAVTALGGVVVLLEVALASPAPVPVPTADASIPAAYGQMAADPAPGAVLDLPLTVPILERGVYAWYQTVHHRPVPWSLNEPMPAALMANRLTSTLIRIEASRARSLPPRLPELDLVIGARTLARSGYRYVVLHEAMIPPFKLRQVRTVLDAVLGPPSHHEDGALSVYRLVAPPEEG